MESVLKYWPVIIGVISAISATITLVFVLGKIWQNIKHLCNSFNRLSAEFAQYKDQAAEYCRRGECKTFRDECAARHEKVFHEIKHALEIMDAKRESSREDAADTLKETNQMLADISCRLGRIEGKVGLHDR